MKAKQGTGETQKRSPLSLFANKALLEVTALCGNPRAVGRWGAALPVLLLLVRSRFRIHPTDTEILLLRSCSVSDLRGKPRFLEGGEGGEEVIECGQQICLRDLLEQQ